VQALAQIMPRLELKWRRISRFTTVEYGFRGATGSLARAAVLSAALRRRQPGRDGTGTSAHADYAGAATANSGYRSGFQFRIGIQYGLPGKTKETAPYGGVDLAQESLKCALVAINLDVIKERPPAASKHMSCLSSTALMN